MTASSPTGLLLANLGTPRSPSTRDVRRYLREFLMDPNVLEMPALSRWALVHLAILPRRPRVAAAAYAKIWSERGSPLLHHSLDLRDRLAEELGSDFRVALGMRYGDPSLASALQQLREAGTGRLVLFPLFPQSARASTTTAIERVRELGGDPDGSMRIVRPFFDHPAHIAALAEVARPALAGFEPDHVLFSYHGLPQSSLRTGSGSPLCLTRASCCDAITNENATCYRAQCFATSRALIASLDLDPEDCSTAFQSRLGRQPWIKPYTDFQLPLLIEGGVRRLAVFCPSFVADCLETLEEIAIRGREQWRSLGGEELELIPCPNAEPPFVSAAATLVRETLAAE
jgi:ferrochelatase